MSEPALYGKKLAVTVFAEPMEQVPPQLIPDGLEVTVPPTMPVFVTVKVTLTVNALALVAVPPAVVTVK